MVSEIFSRLILKASKSSGIMLRGIFQLLPNLSYFMGNYIKSRTGKVLILSSSQALTTLIAIFSGAVLTRLLSKADFGSYRQTMLALTLASPFLMLGLDRVLYVFLPNEPQKTRRILVENLILLTIAGGLLSLFLFFGGHLLLKRFNNPVAIHLLSILFIYPLFSFPAYSLSGCLLARERADQLAIFNVISRILMFLLIAIPCFFWPFASTPIIGNVLWAFLTMPIAIFLMWKACPARNWRPTWSGLRRQLSFSTPLGLSSIIGIASMTLDQMLVSLRCSPEIFAVYTVGAMEIPLIGIVTSSITAVILVDYARYYRDNNYQGIIALIHQAMSKSAFFLFFAMTFLFCVAPQLMRLLFGKGYESSSVIFRIYLLLLPMRTITFGAVLQGTDNTKHILYQSILGLIANAILGWVLIGKLGAPGAAWGSVLATYLVSIPYLILVIRRILKINVSSLFPWKDLGKLLSIALIPLILYFCIISILPMSDLYSVIIAVLLFLPLIFSRMSRDQSIIGILKKAF